MTREKGIKGCIRALFLLVLLASIQVITFANVPQTIKVGLESVYKNQKAITLSSDSNMEIGFFYELGFRGLGQLDSSVIILRSSTSTYYDLGLTFKSYEAAKEAMKIYGSGSVIAYIPGGSFGLYSLSPEGTLGSVVSTSPLVEVYDNQNNLLMLTVKKSDLVFRGYHNASGLNLTKVGNQKLYRGAIGVAGTTGLTPYNAILTEEYLYGVVPKEMSASWPIEALKAQAVAARSIATYQYNRYISSGYNVVDTTATQAYGGYTVEAATTNQAVDKTYGEVIRYNGKIAEALYFSTSGGITESAKEVWGSDIPYLQSVLDRYETEPAAPAWTRNITLSEVETCLSRSGINIGSVTGLAITKRSPAGRAKQLTILGTVGSYSVTKDQVRSFFSGSNGGSLRSTYFSFYGPVGMPSLGGGTVSNTVTVLSGRGMSKVNMNNLVATSQIEMSHLPSRVAVQSATGITYINGEGSTGGSSDLGLETVTNDFTVYGAGYGHGVGMSQSGAKGMAKAGFRYDEILKYYYQGITVSR